MTPTPAWYEADSDDSDRNATDDNTASTPDAARGAILPASDAAGGYADADELRGRITALERVSAENERLRAQVERLTEELDRERLSQDYKPDGVDIVMGKLQDARRERDAYREQWHQEVENFERETARAEAAEAKLRDVEAVLDRVEREQAAGDEWDVDEVVHDLRLAVLAPPQAPQAPAGEGVASVDPALRDAHAQASYDYAEACANYEDALASRDPKVRTTAEHALRSAGQRLSEALSAVVAARQADSSRPPTFTHLLLDPTQQLDPDGAVMATIVAYQNATTATMSARSQAPQAPAEQEGLQLPPRPTVHDGTGPVDGVTRCCGVRMTDLSPIDRVTMFASQVTCIAPSVRPAMADDEGVRRG